MSLISAEDPHPRKRIAVEDSEISFVDTGGDGPINYADLDLNPAEFDGTGFSRTDYRFENFRADAPASWTIVVKSSMPGGPPGEYRLNSDGSSSEDDG